MDKQLKYVEKANRIIGFLNQQDEKTWARTQRELSDELGLSHPELSSLVKMLVEQDKVVRGQPLPGVRGRNHTLILRDPTPLEGAVAPRRATVTLVEDQVIDDCVLELQDPLTSSVDLRTISPEVVGTAVINLLRQSWSQTDRLRRIREEQNNRLHEFRDLLAKERNLRSKLVDEKEHLEKRINELISENAEVRGRLNELIIQQGNKQGGRGTFTVRESLDEESQKVLDRIMRTPPGDVRAAADSFE